MLTRLIRKYLCYRIPGECMFNYSCVHWILVSSDTYIWLWQAQPFLLVKEEEVLNWSKIIEIRLRETKERTRYEIMSYNKSLNMYHDKKKVK